MKRLFGIAIIAIAELSILAAVGREFSSGAAFGVIVATGAISAVFARKKGFVTWSRIQYDLQQGRYPESKLIDDITLLAASVLLIAPGVLTDAVGLVSLVPMARRPLLHWIVRKLRHMQSTGRIGLRGFFE